MIRALFFDLDGTLLTTDKRLSDANAAALAACRERGIGIYCATGRLPRAPRVLGWGIRELSLFDGGIYSNGGYEIVNSETRCYYIPSDVVRKTVECVNDYPDLHFALQMANDIHALNHELGDHVLPCWGISRDEIVPIEELRMDQIIKLLVYYGDFGDNFRLLPEEMVKRVYSLCKNRAQCYLTDHDCLIQISAWEASKASAIRRVTARLGLREDEIAVFGDDYNDLEMIRAFPESVAMGNACPELKAAAKYVTLSNDADGIAHALREILHLI